MKLLNHIVVTSIAPLRKQPSDDSEQISQLLFGEPFEIIEQVGMWAKGSCGRDKYEGYILAANLASAPQMPATHRIKAIQSHAYNNASIKAPVVRALWRGSLLHVSCTLDTFAVLADGSHVPLQDIAPLNSFQTDWTAEAADMLGTPYLWGGRSRQGIDCSGLVQVALQACGVYCPRDSGDQKVLGHPVVQAELQRGDLVFFPGHVGIMADASQLLHANAFHMRTVIEPLAIVVDRLASTVCQPVTAMRRLQLL